MVFLKSNSRKVKKVIVEGVQISDDWLKANKSGYQGKPVVVLGTNPLKSMKRAFERDDRGNIIQGLASLDNTKEFVEWYFRSNKTLDDLAKETDAIKLGKQIVKEMIL